MSSYLKKLADLPLFVPLIGAYPVAFLAGRNAGQFSVPTALLIAMLLVLGTLGFYLLFRWRTRSQLGAGVAAVLALVMFFSFPQFVSLTGWLATTLKLGDNETPYALDAAPHLRNTLAFVWAAMAWAFGLRIARARWANRVETSKALTFAGIVLLTISIVPLLFSTMRSSLAQGADSRPFTVQSGSGQHLAAPDVYFIVLDGYARADILDRYYQYDNRPFLDALQSRGFRIADESSVNYNWTFLSISSTLNLGYLQELFGDKLNPDNRDRTAMYESIRDSATAAFLKQHGYRIVHFQSTWGATASNPYADKQIKCEHQVFDDEFARALVEASWLGAFSNKATVDLAQCHLANFEALTRIGSSPGPKFVFAHFVLPHHPYLFDRTGNILRNATVSNQFEFQKRLWEDKQGYLGQLEYVNGLVLQALDGIIERSSAPPVVVLVSDHGPNLAQGLSRKQYVGVRFANLAAYLLPGAPVDLMPSNGSAVNQFRRILSHYFDATLPPLPDRYFQSPYGAPFDFLEVPTWVLRSEWGGTPPPPTMAAQATQPSTDAKGDIHAH